MKKPFILSALSLLFTFGALFAQSHKIWWAPNNGGALSTGSIVSYNTLTDSLEDNHSFKRTHFGSSPLSGPLTVGSDSCIYGSTYRGELNPIWGNGNLFKYDPRDSSYQVLHFINSLDHGPINGLIVDSNLNIYGVSNVSIFKFSVSTNTFSALHQWNTATGDYPNSGMICASNGLLYGVTASGGNYNRGVFYSFDTVLNIYTVLRHNPLNNPIQCPIEYSPGILIGVAALGGSGLAGEIYQYNIATGIYSTLYSFNSSICSRPRNKLIKGVDGKIYGTTGLGGNSGVGTIYSYDVSTNIFTKLYDFPSNGPIGYAPSSGLFEDSAGVFYGVTSLGGTETLGSIYKFNNNTSVCTEVHALVSKTEGDGSYTDFTKYIDGRLFAFTTESTSAGYSPANHGTVFSIDPTTDSYHLEFAFDQTPEGTNPQGLYVASDGNVYGINVFECPVPILYKYDPSIDSLIVLKYLPEIVGNGQTLVGFRAEMTEINNIIYGSVHESDSFPSGAYFAYDILNDQITYSSFLFDTISLLVRPSPLYAGADGFLYGSCVQLSTIPFTSHKGYTLRVNPLNLSIDTLFSTSTVSYKGELLFNFSKNKFIQILQAGYNDPEQLLVYDLLTDSIVYTYVIDSLTDYTTSAFLVDDSTIICFSTIIFGTDYGQIYKVDMKTSSRTILYTFPSNLFFHYTNNNYMSDGFIYGMYQNNQGDVLYRFDPLTLSFTLIKVIPIFMGTVPRGRLQESPLVTRLNDEVKENTVAYLFPNPCSSFINIKNTKANNSIKIYDVFGKLIHTSKTNHEITRVETVNLTPGMYLIHYIENKKIHVMKMVKI